MLLDEDVSPALGRLSALKYFPTSPQALRAIGEVLKQAKDSADLDRAIGEILASHDAWPGPATLGRAVLNGRSGSVPDGWIKVDGEYCWPICERCKSSGYVVELTEYDCTGKRSHPERRLGVWTREKEIAEKERLRREKTADPRKADLDIGTRGVECPECWSKVRAAKAAGYPDKIYLSGRL